MIERILLSSLFVACSWVVKGQDLSGSWVYKETRKGVSYYSKEARMEIHRSGFEFGQDGQITIRRNESSCGTPPIRYQNYRGTWRMNTDSVITTTYRFHSSNLENDSWKLVFVSKDSLALKYKG